MIAALQGPTPTSSLVLCALLATACIGRISDPRRDAAADVALEARADAALDALVASDVTDEDRAAADGGDAGATVIDGCAAPQSSCEGRCVPLAEDLTNCGACGRVCAVPRASARCSLGACRVGTCEPSFGDCNSSPDDGCEAWLGSIVNCGRCGNVCGPSQPECNETLGRCVTGCAPSLSRCGPLCVDTQASVAHCGSCSNACSFANATARCELGRCALGACLAGFADCDGTASNGCETRLSTPSNCARCGDRCDATTPVCDLVARRCSDGCAAPATRCGALCVERSTDVEHCGACDNRCSFANAAARCLGGVCQMGACLPGFADCDRSAINGCEVDARSSISNCGACNQRCAPGDAVAVCADGSCAYSSCNPDFGDCDRIPANGCETALSSNPNHCGACGNACRPANATPSCSSSRCGYLACLPGFGDCDAVRANGCETSLDTSLTHCGACGRGCAIAHAIAACTAGRCDYRQCLAPFADCDGNRANGCETDSASSTDHCGACGAACAPGQTCSAGSCR